MTKQETKDLLILAGVKNLKTFGYPKVNIENILTDELYSAFFQNMLEDNIGKGTKKVDDVINDLIKTISQNQSPKTQ